MTTHVRILVSVLAAAALVGSILTSAFAGQSSPLKNLAQSNAKRVTIQGGLTVTDVLRVMKNSSVYGRLYAHGGAQVWKGLTITSGGVKADSLDVAGVIQGQTANIKDALQASSITSATVTTTGDAHIGGVLAATGKVSGNGMDAGAGGLSTTGNINGGALTVTSITDAGNFTTGAIQATGTLQAGNTTLTGLTVNGPVNLTNAQVTGLNISNLLNGSSFPTLSVGTQLSVGTSAQTTAPLLLSQNSHSIAIGVDTTGALATTNLTLGAATQTSSPLVLSENNKTVSLGVNTAGNATVDSLVTTSTTAGLTVTGTAGVVTPLLQGLPTSGTTVPGVLSLQGTDINLNGAVHIVNFNDLTFSRSSSGAAATHILAQGDGDVAGTVAVNLLLGTCAAPGCSAAVTFVKPYATTPTIVVTPMVNPDPERDAAPKIFVVPTNGTGGVTGFTVYEMPAGAEAAAHTIQFAYHIISP
jgi:hypothetical protein